MASVAEGPARTGGGGTGWVSTIDRWIYVFMAGLFFVTALAGFVPDSFVKLAAIEAGERAAFPPVLHVHAVLMGAWLTLLLAQTTLMATGRQSWHRQLGVTALVLAPGIVISGLVLVPVTYGMFYDFASTAPPEAQEQAQKMLAGRPNIMLQQLKAGIVFPLCVFLALRARRRDAGFHKRMMILAALTPLSAAFARLPFLPSTMPQSPLSLDLFTLVWLAPMFAWDIYRQRRIHQAYIVWFALFGGCCAIAYVIWGNQWWQTFVPRLFGYP